MVKINGKELNLAGKPLKKYLESAGSDGDEIEIVSFVGGG